jgi:glycerophosphoryl diester phosphodiesterase
VIIFAHRGLKSKRPENTLSAFEMAFDNGFGIEFDVRMTKDKHLVVIHDRDPWRVTGIHGDVSEMTLNELKKMNFGTSVSESFLNTKIATIEEVFELISQKMPDGQKSAIHLKYDEQNKDTFKMVFDLIEKFSLHEKVFIFDLTLENAKKINHKIKIGISIGENNYSPTIFQWDQVSNKVADFDYVWLDEWKIDESVYNKKLVDLIHEAGKKIYVISPELHGEHGHPRAKSGFENIWTNLIEWGVDGICTAHPGKLKDILSLTK